jgi:hypothetical protein
MKPRSIDFLNIDWAIRIWEVISFTPLGIEKGVRIW